MRNFFVQPYLLLLTCSILLCLQVKAQNLGINKTGATANSAALLDVDASGMSPKKGILIPRVTQAEKTAMNPLPVGAQGLTVYQTDGVQGYYYNTSTTLTPSWQYLTTSATGWNTYGNTLTGTLPASPAEWIGSINNAALIFKTNNAEQVRISNTGNVGIGTSIAGKKLDVNGTIRLLNHFIFNSANGVINWGNTGHLYFRTNPSQGDEASYIDRMILSNQGYLGINAGIPSSPLQIDQFYNLTVPIVNLRQTIASWGTVGYFNNYRYLQTNYSGPGYEYKQFNVGAGGVSIGYPDVPTYGSSDALYINGNVGIGTTTPTTAKLVIDGPYGEQGLDLSTADQYANMRVLQNSNSALDRDMYFGYSSGSSSSLHLYSNNVETMTVRAGNVGIGTTDPNGYKLNVSGADNAIKINGTGGVQQFGQLNFGDANYVYLKEDVDDKLSISANRTALIGGNVTIGTTTENARLTIQGAGGISKALYVQGGYTVFDNNSGTQTGYAVHAGALAISGNVTGGDGEVDFINVGPAGSDRGFRFWVQTASNITTSVVRIKQNGECWAQGIFLLSDKSLKRDILPLTPSQTSKLLSLKTYSYHYDKEAIAKVNHGYTDRLTFGLMAQELETLFPNLVDTDERGVKAVNYIGLIPVVIETIKQQNKAIEELTKRLEALEKK